MLRRHNGWRHCYHLLLYRVVLLEHRISTKGVAGAKKLGVANWDHAIRDSSPDPAGVRPMLSRPLLVLALISGAHPARAQAPVADTTSRARLARLLLGFEYAIRDRAPAPEAVPGLSRAFDMASLAFFGGRSAEAAGTIDSLIRSVEPDSARRAGQAEEAVHTLAKVTAERRVFHSPDGREVPWVLRLPDASATEARPLVIALHGAGGDERMWLAAYGAGMLAPMVAARGAILASPLTTALRDGASLDALIAAVSTEAPVDRSRIYLLGHSMGAMTAWRLAQQRPRVVAAVVCLAGGCGTPAPGDSTPLPPLYVAAGALDPLAAPARLEPAVTAARAAGRVVEWRVIRDRGHTLMVPEALPDALTWLLAQRLGGR
jgi:predicted esterase